MEDHIIKIPGNYSEIDIRCPKCNSDKVLVTLSNNGYYHVLKCNKCGFEGKNN